MGEMREEQKKLATSNKVYKNAGEKLKENEKDRLENKVDYQRKVQEKELMRKETSLKRKETRLKKKEIALKKKERGLQKREENKKFIRVAFSVLLAAAVAYLLDSLVTGVPIGDSVKWIFYSLIVVVSTVGFICYIFDTMPDDIIIGLKTVLIILVTMTIFGFSRFYYFFNELQTPELAVIDSLGLNYYTFLIFFSFFY